MTGLEPAASGVTGRRSNQLSYTPPYNLLPTSVVGVAGRSCNTGLVGCQVESNISPLQWWAVTGSNRRPFGCKPNALPAELTALDFMSCILLWNSSLARKEHIPNSAKKSRPSSLTVGFDNTYYNGAINLRRTLILCLL